MASLLRGVALIITLITLAAPISNISAHTQSISPSNSHSVTSFTVDGNPIAEAGQLNRPAAAGLFYYVAVTGNDSNPGTQAQPFRTINRGASVLNPGDTLLVGAGTYNEYINNSIPSGLSWSQPVTVQASPRNSVTITPPGGSDRAMTFDRSTQYVIVDGFILDGSTASIDTLKFQGDPTRTDNPNHIRIMNTEIKNAPQQGILVSQTDTYIELINLVVHDNGSTDFDHGMYIQGDHILIQGCTIYNNAGWGIHIYGGAPNDVTVQGNKIYDNARLGLRGFGIGVYTGARPLVYNNIIWGKNQGGIDVGYGVTDAGIYNNTVVNNRESGITVLDSSTNASLKNNLVLQPDLVLVDNGVNTTKDHNYLGDPQFVNAASFDFHLKANSPAINSGTTVSQVVADFDGVARPQAGVYDVGAYEFVSAITPTSTVLPSATPTNTLTPTNTPLPSVTPTNTLLPSATPSSTPSPTSTGLPTATATVPPSYPIDTIGVYRPSTAAFYLRNSNTTGAPDIITPYGTASDVPVVGDWNGDGIDTAGVYRKGQFLLTDSTTPNGPVTYSVALGKSGDLPVIGDWDGNGKDGIGVYRPSTGMVYLKNNLVSGHASYTMAIGQPGDLPVAGDWNGDGKDSPGVYRPSTSTFLLTNKICNCTATINYTIQFGQSGDKPFTGDWNGDNLTGLGVFHAANGLISLKNTLNSSPADITLAFGQPGDIPVAGHWANISGTVPTATSVPPTATPKLAPTFVP